MHFEGIFALGVARAAKSALLAVLDPDLSGKLLIKTFQQCTPKLPV